MKILGAKNIRWMCHTLRVNIPTAYISNSKLQIDSSGQPGQPFNSAWSWTVNGVKFCLKNVPALIAEYFQFQEKMKYHLIILWILVLQQIHRCRKVFTRAGRLDHKTFPEGQWAQGIDSLTWIISPASESPTTQFLGGEIGWWNCQLDVVC